MLIEEIVHLILTVCVSVNYLNLIMLLKYRNFLLQKSFSFLTLITFNYNFNKKLFFVL